MAVAQGRNLTISSQHCGFESILRENGNNISVMAAQISDIMLTDTTTLRIMPLSITDTANNDAQDNNKTILHSV